MKRVSPYFSYLKTLREIHDLESGNLVELGEVNQQFMCNTTVRILEAYCVMLGKPLCHVVCVEQCNVSRLRKTSATQHLNVRP